jgi:hypothetical protein
LVKLSDYNVKKDFEWEDDLDGILDEDKVAAAAAAAVAVAV